MTSLGNSDRTGRWAPELVEGSWTGPRKSGARKSRKQAEPRPMDHNLKTPEVVAGEGVRSLAPSSLDCRSKLEEAKMQLILDKLAEGTQKSYSVGWRWWCLFCKARGIEAYRTVNESTLSDEQHIVLDFVLHLAEHGGKAVGTIKQYLSAVRSQHLMAGFPDPTRPMLRVWMVLEGLKKRQGGPRRKRPATPRMLRWIRSKLDIDKRHDDAMLWCAILMAFYFLLRSSEYVAPDQSGADSGKGVRGMDLTAKLKGERVKRFSDADEVVLCIRGSKTDQLNRGEWRNHFRIEGNEDLCLLKALSSYEKHAPGQFTGDGSMERLFKRQSGTYLVRADIQSTLENAAIAEGSDPSHLGTHSLRIGGASALWAMYKDSALVQRWERWSSDCFLEGMTQKMSMADMDLV